MCEENLDAKEILEAQICKCIRQGLKVMPWPKANWSSLDDPPGPQVI